MAMNQNYDGAIDRMIEQLDRERAREREQFEDEQEMQRLDEQLRQIEQDKADEANPEWLGGDQDLHDVKDEDE